MEDPTFSSQPATFVAESPKATNYISAVIENWPFLLLRVCGIPQRIASRHFLFEDCFMSSVNCFPLESCLFMRADER